MMSRLFVTMKLGRDNFFWASLEILNMSFLPPVQLMFKISNLAQKKLSLPSFIVTKSLDIIELSTKNAEKFSILIGNFVLGHSIVAKS